MIDSSNSPKSRLQFRCISHLSEDQALAILQQIDRNHQNRTPIEKVPTQRPNPVNLAVHQRNTWAGHNQQLQRHSSQKVIKREDSPLRSFIKQPSLGELNYEYVVTWYQKLALENAMIGRMSGGFPQSAQMIPRHNTALLKRI